MSPRHFYVLQFAKHFTHIFRHPGAKNRKEEANNSVKTVLLILSQFSRKMA